jgi:hypothetical protein
MTKKFSVEVIRCVIVEVDEEKFTDKFMEEYRESFDDSFYELEDHIKQLGWLYGAGRIDGGRKEFIEGYGPANELGIKFSDDGADDVLVLGEIND